MKWIRYLPSILPLGLNYERKGSAVVKILGPGKGDSGLSFATGFLRPAADQFGLDALGIWATGSRLFLVSGSVTLTVSV